MGGKPTKEAVVGEGELWQSAAEEAVPWPIVRDELRQQAFSLEAEKDLSPPRPAEAAELDRRRARALADMTGRVAKDIARMHSVLDTKVIQKGDARPLIRATTFSVRAGRAVGGRACALPWVMPAASPPSGQVLNEADQAPGAVGGAWAADVSARVDVSRRWYAESASASSLDYFISHAWDDDGDAKGMGGVPTTANPAALDEWGRRKAVAFQNVVRTIVEMREAAEGGRRPDRRALKFWVDKVRVGGRRGRRQGRVVQLGAHRRPRPCAQVCIPQFDHALKHQCVQNLETFIREANGLIVLFNPRYSARLWCVFEWAVFLCMKSPKRVFVNHRSFADKGNQQAYLRAVRQMRIATLSCQVEADRQVLIDKVRAYYVDEAAFVRFAQLTMISLIVRDYLAYPHLVKTSHHYAEHVTPWVELAASMGFGGLHAALKDFDVPQQFAAANFQDEVYMRALDQHLNARLYPLLEQERVRACSDRGKSLWKP